MSVQEEPGIGDISPVAAAGVPKEPMALIDTTGSMTWDNEEGSGMARKDVLGEAMGIIVEKLGAEDSQAAAEEEAGEDAGGLMTVTFAVDNVQKIGDLSPDNWGSPGMIGGDDTRTRVFFLALRTASPVFRHDARSTPG